MVIITEEQRLAILRLKRAPALGALRSPGVDIYAAVVDHDVTTPEAFMAWQTTNRERRRGSLTMNTGHSGRYHPGTVPCTYTSGTWCSTARRRPTLSRCRTSFCGSDSEGTRLRPSPPRTAAVVPR